MSKKRSFSDDDYFRLFASCIPVLGAKRSLICDLQNEKYLFVPNSLVKMLTILETTSISEYIQNNEANTAAIIEYIDFLINRRLGFTCQKKYLTNYPKIDLSWDFPAKISNAVIDVDEQSNHDFTSIFKQLDRLGCRSVEIRLFYPVSILFLDDIMALLEKMGITSIEFSIPYFDDLKQEDLIDLCYKYPRIRTIYVYASAIEDLICTKKNYMGNILYIKSGISTAPTKIIANPLFFTINSGLFTESQKHNAYFNRKISIDINSKVKNCSSHLSFFGDARKNMLEEIIDKPDFKQLWFTPKDDIRTCRDCEFRYVCVDPRVPIYDNNEAEYYFKENCNYDPYTATFQ